MFDKVLVETLIFPTCVGIFNKYVQFNLAISFQIVPKRRSDPISKGEKLVQW